MAGLATDISMSDYLDYVVPFSPNFGLLFVITIITVVQILTFFKNGKSLRKNSTTLSAFIFVFQLYRVLPVLMTSANILSPIDIQTAIVNYGVAIFAHVHCN